MKRAAARTPLTCFTAFFAFVMLSVFSGGAIAAATGARGPLLVTVVLVTGVLGLALVR